MSDTKKKHNEIDRREEKSSSLTTNSSKRKVWIWLVLAILAIIALAIIFELK